MAITIKSNKEIELMEDVCKIVAKFYEQLEKEIKPGISTYDLDQKAEKIIKKKNRKRRNYYMYYTNKEWGNAASYDITINSKIGVEACVDALEVYIKNRFKLD